MPDPEYPSLHVTTCEVVVRPLTLPSWSLFVTTNAPQVPALQVTVLHLDVILPDSAVHVAGPDPEYPSAQVTRTDCVVVPELAPSCWSLFATVNEPHEAGVHVMVVHLDVTLSGSARQVAVPDPEYPSSHFTARNAVVVPELVPPLWSLNGTLSAPHEAATHVTVLHVEVVKPEFAVHVDTAEPLYPSSHLTDTVCVVVPLRAPAFWSLNGTLNAPQEAATHVTALHVDVTAPGFAVHVAVPDPEYPSSHFTTMLCVVVPDREPAFWSLNGTVNAPHEAATHVGLIHVDVTWPTLAVHVALPDPEYPSSHLTKRI